MSDTTADESTGTGEGLKQTVRVEDAGPSRKRLVIEIPAEVVDEQLGSSFDTLSRDADVPGFRRGRAPRRLIERKFGSAVRSEARNQLMARAYAEAIESEGLKVLSEPSPDDVDAPELEAGSGLTIRVEVDVLPSFELPETDGIAVRRPIIEVGDALVDAEVGRLVVNEGTLEERESPEPGDYLTGHGVMRGMVDGEERVFHDINGCVVRVPPESENGRGMILGVVVDDLTAQLGLPSAGDEVTVTTTGPEQHENEDIRGVPLTVTFAVQRIDRIVPATVPELVERYNAGTEQSLREAIHRELVRRAGVQQTSVMRQQVARHLLDSTEMELPERLSAAQAENIFHRRRLELQYRGVPEDQIERHIAELRAAATSSATVELKLQFILHALAEKLEIQVTEGELNGRIAELAFQRRVRPEDLRRQLIQSRQVSQVVQQIRDHKVLDALLEKASIEEMPADEFNEQMKKLAAGGVEDHHG